ncbi:hypothetical protein LCH21_03100 [Patescibacteria group bacterium]|jgi:hypothetical protein|nr:hypothetical protein [Patescibacteria group bacterium]
MDKKVTITIIGVVVFVVAGVLLFTGMNKDKSSDKQTTATTNSKTIEQKDEEDLGLCKVVDMTTIKSALGAAADTLSGPNNTGVTSLGDGDKGQTCVYPFSEGGSQSNSFYTDLADYSQESFDNVADITATSGSDVSGVGDRAKFTSGDTLTGTMEYTITAVKDTKVYLFVISQPKDATTFDESSALSALTTIARAAKLN